MWKDYIVILGSRDWYVIYDKTLHIRARTFEEAERKALKGQPWYVEVCSTTEIDGASEINIRDHNPKSG